MKKRLLLSLLIISFCFISIGCSLLGVSSTSKNEPTVSPKPTPELESQAPNNEPTDLMNNLMSTYQQYGVDKQTYNENQKTKDSTDQYKSKAKQYIDAITKKFTQIEKSIKNKEKCSDSLTKLSSMVSKLSSFQAEENYSGGFDFLEKEKFKDELENLKSCTRPQTDVSLVSHDELNKPLNNRNSELWIWILIGALVPILLSTILSFLLFRRAAKLKVEISKLRSEVRAIDNNLFSQNGAFTNSITNCENSILRIRNSLPPDLTDQVSTLKAQIQSLRARDGNSPAIVRNSEPVSSELTVSNYLTQAAGRMVRANSVFMRPETLTQDADGKFVLMQNQRGQHLAIPNLPRFGSAQDYSHFQKFYDCDQPAAGEIIIVEPAIVNQDPASGEWNLAKKGTLQISSR